MALVLSTCGHSPSGPTGELLSNNPGMSRSPSTVDRLSTCFSSRLSFPLFSLLVLLAALNVKLFAKHLHEILIRKVMVSQ